MHTFRREGSFADRCRRSTAAWMAIVATAAAPAMLPVRAFAQGGPSAREIHLKTSPANAQAIRPFADALLAFDNAGRANNGKPPADAARRIAELERLAPAVKAEIRSYGNRLQQANETGAFDEIVYQKAKESGQPGLDAQIRSAGGPSALLLKSDAIIDDLIADRKHVASSGKVDHLAEALGLSVVLEASFGSTVCGMFWFTISLGYGETHAYYSCYY